MKQPNDLTDIEAVQLLLDVLESHEPKEWMRKGYGARSRHCASGFCLHDLDHKDMKAVCALAGNDPLINAPYTGRILTAVWRLSGTRLMCINDRGASSFEHLKQLVRDIIQEASEAERQAAQQAAEIAEQAAELARWEPVD
jgi:hypothetical protein